MQATETDSNKGDEEAINFRPSPNFKHMKKYLKSKFEEARDNCSTGEQTSPPSAEEDSQPGAGFAPGPAHFNSPSQVNGLSHVNGLSCVDGLLHVDGLTNVDGLSNVDGISNVDGLSNVDGTSQVNSPSHVDGLLHINGCSQVNSPKAGPDTGPTAGSVPGNAPASGPAPESAIESALGPALEPAVGPAIGPTLGATMGPLVGPAPAPGPVAAATAAMSTSVQPPLPPHPPPPDLPLQITLKREIEDEEYHGGAGPAPAAAAADDPGDKVMCRQYVRGACTRGPTCIYAHELILSQLPGIYTFCKNFQNSGCSFPKCKFVHATVFEKERFYRTGYLPPHALAHLKDAAPSAPPPLHRPPPPPPPPGTACAEVPTAFPNPPPAILIPGAGGGAGGGGGAVAGGSGAGAADALGVLAAAVAASSPLKRAWTDLGDLGGAGRDRDISLVPPGAKKCKKCDLTELRLQCNKSKAEKLRRSSLELSLKIAALNKKSNEMSAVVCSLIKHSNAAKTGLGVNFFNNAVNNPNNRSDKKEDLVDKLKRFLASNNRASLSADDISTKNLNLPAMLMRLLRSVGGGAGGASDAS